MQMNLLINNKEKDMRIIQCMCLLRLAKDSPTSLSLEIGHIHACLYLLSSVDP